jgi:hypothetical protein
MEENKVMKVAAYGFIGLVVVPAVIGAGLNLVGHAVNGLGKLVHNHKIKKGLKDGRIVEIDGCYYEVATGEEA